MIQLQTNPVGTSSIKTAAILHCKHQGLYRQHNTILDST